MATPHNQVIGIDCGTSVVKAGAFLPDGTEIAVAQAEVAQTSQRPGRIEVDPDAIWTAVCQTLRRLRAEAAPGSGPWPVDAVALTGAGNGLFLLDADGNPVRPGIQAVDNRVAPSLPRPDDFQKQARAIHGQGNWPGQTIELLAWTARHEPETFAMAHTACVVKDFIKWRMTGIHATDVSEQSKIGLIDLRERRPTHDLLALYGLPDAWTARLPAPSRSEETIGHVTPAAAQATGLPAGLPVANGMADIDASALGAGASSPGQLSIVAGTWSINQLFTAAPEPRATIFGVSWHAVDGVAESLEASASSTANMSWFMRECCKDIEAEARQRGLSPYALANDHIAEIPPATTPVFFHPYLFGANIAGNARAGFYGLAGWHDRRHLLAALIEGVTFSHALHVERLLEGGRSAAEIRLSGGAANSRIWSQQFADVLGLPVVIGEAREPGALGAAMAAACAAGHHATLADAVRAMQRSGSRHDPDPELHRAYSARFESYKSITNAMLPVWDELDRGFQSSPPTTN